MLSKRSSREGKQPFALSEGSDSLHACLENLRYKHLHIYVEKYFKMILNETSPS